MYHLDGYNPFVMGRNFTRWVMDWFRKEQQSLQSKFKIYIVNYTFSSIKDIYIYCQLYFVFNQRYILSNILCLQSKIYIVNYTLKTDVKQLALCRIKNFASHKYFGRHVCAG